MLSAMKSRIYRHDFHSERYLKDQLVNYSIAQNICKYEKKLDRLKKKLGPFASYKYNLFCLFTISTEVLPVSISSCHIGYCNIILYPINKEIIIWMNI
jgi:hypothetical protein